MGTRSPPQQTPPAPAPVPAPLLVAAAQHPTLLGPTRPPAAGRERAGSATASGAGRGGEGAGPGRGVALVRQGQPPGSPRLASALCWRRNGTAVFTEVKRRCSSRRFSCEGRYLRWQQLSGLNSNNTCSEIKEAWLCVGVGFYMRIECLLTVSSKPKKRLLGFLRC